MPTHQAIVESSSPRPTLKSSERIAFWFTPVILCVARISAPSIRMEETSARFSIESMFTRGLTPGRRAPHPHARSAGTMHGPILEPFHAPRYRG